MKKVKLPMSIKEREDRINSVTFETFSSLEREFTKNIVKSDALSFNIWMRDRDLRSTCAI